jgi:hypothetical protein
VHHVLLSKPCGGGKLRVLAQGAVQLVSQGRPVLPAEPELREEARFGVADGMLASLPRFEPPAQRCLRFARPSAGKKAFDTDVLIEVGPMNALSLTNESPIRAFRLVAMCESGAPRHRHRNRPTINKMDYERVLGY